MAVTFDGYTVLPCVRLCLNSYLYVYCSYVIVCILLLYIPVSQLCHCLNCAILSNNHCSWRMWVWSIVTPMIAYRDSPPVIKPFFTNETVPTPADFTHSINHQSCSVFHQSVNGVISLLMDWSIVIGWT